MCCLVPFSAVIFRRVVSCAVILCCAGQSHAISSELMLMSIPINTRSVSVGTPIKGVMGPLCFVWKSNIKHSPL